MKRSFWIRRFAVVLFLAFLGIAVGQQLRGRTLEHSVREGAIWAPIAATIFIGSAMVRVSRAARCAVCRDDSDRS